MPRVTKLTMDGAKLGAAIASSGLTVTGVAARAGLCTETVRIAMRGRPLGAVSAGAICRAVRLPLSALLARGEQGAGTRNDVAATRAVESERGEPLAASA